MRVIVNDYRGRNPKDDLDGMIHLLDCGDTPPNPREWWRKFPSLEDAKEEFQNHAVCNNCLPGMGRHLVR